MVISYEMKNAVEHKSPDFRVECHPALGGIFLSNFGRYHDPSQKGLPFKCLASVTKTQDIGRNILPAVNSVYFPHPPGVDEYHRQGTILLAERLQDPAAERRD